jgi:enamine deaminase RidA (YjgF/YER057c/UK114 family)
MDQATIRQKLSALGCRLPLLPVSKGIYKRCVAVGNVLYVSGHISINNDGTPITGKAGLEVTDDEAKAAACQCGLAILAAVEAHTGSLDKVKRVVKLLGMVNASPDYTRHPEIINGCSELYANLWGEDNGIGVRSAVGVGSLPGNVTVEMEAIFELHD